MDVNQAVKALRNLKGRSSRIMEAVAVVAEARAAAEEQRLAKQQQQARQQTASDEYHALSATTRIVVTAQWQTQVSSQCQLFTVVFHDQSHYSSDSASTSAADQRQQHQHLSSNQVHHCNMWIHEQCFPRTHSTTSCWHPLNTQLAPCPVADVDMGTQRCDPPDL
jgi:hypothetical protein